MRTFHQRFTLSAKIAILLAVSLSFYLFWNKMILGGLIVAFAVVMMIERVSHTNENIIWHEPLFALALW